MSKIAIQPKVSRDVYFKFKAFAQANGIPIEKAIEELMRQALACAGIEVIVAERASQHCSIASGRALCGFGEKRT